MHRKNKESFGMQTKAPYDDGSSKRGGLYFKSGKDACMPSNLKVLHILVIVTGRSSMKSSKIVDKERIIELMITKNRFKSWNEKRMR
jgi:hypothetical protein